MNPDVRMSVKECAKIMGVSEQFVRVGLQQGLFSWGYVIKLSTHYTYFINRHKFLEEMGLNK